MTYTKEGWADYWEKTKEKHNARRREKYRKDKRYREAALRRSEEQRKRKAKGRVDASQEES